MKVLVTVVALSAVLLFGEVLKPIARSVFTGLNSPESTATSPFGGARL